MGEDQRKHALVAWRRSLCTAWWFCILIYLQLESLNIFYLMKPYSHLWVTFMNLLRYFRYWWKVTPKRSWRKGIGWHYNIGRCYWRATTGNKNYELRTWSIEFFITENCRCHNWNKVVYATFDLCQSFISTTYVNFTMKNILREELSNIFLVWLHVVSLDSDFKMLALVFVVLLAYRLNQGCKNRESVVRRSTLF